MSWVLVCLWRVISAPTYGSAAWELLSSGYNLEFVAGVVCGVVLRKYRIPAPLLVMICGVVLFVFAAATLRWSHATHVARVSAGLYTTGLSLALFSAASALLVMGGAALDIAKAYTPPRAFSFLGAASYSVYLTHVLVISAVSKVLIALNRHVPVPAWAVFFVACVAALIGSLLFYIFVERPMLGWIRERPVTTPASTA